MSKHHPYHERGRGLIGVDGGGTAGVAVTVHGPGQYPDGQDQHGVNLDNVHRGEGRPYDHPHGHAYREDLRSRPSAKPHRIFGKAARPESRRMPTRSKS
jgi:hypothetical protein